MSTIVAQICIRRDTAANFTSANPTLALGEIAYETDTRNLKVGDGATAWTALPYINPYRAGTAAAPTSNTVLGSGAGAALQSGAINNTMIGISAGLNVTTGTENTFVGGGAGITLTGNSNAALGTFALGSNHGSSNTAVGRAALNAHTGNHATAVGTNAALLNTASDTVAIGSGALDANTSGTSNTAVGRNALGANTTGAGNVAIGGNAFTASITASNNVVIGNDAGQGIVSNLNNTLIGANCGQLLVGGTNTVIGAVAMYQVTSANGNVAVGNNAGRYRGATGNTALASATESIFIGNSSRAAGDSQTNQVVIAGTEGVGNGSNTTTIGNSSTTGTFIPAGNLTLTDGNLIVASGHGIDFSATTNSSGTMTSELLADYEEGTWSPVYAPATGAFAAITMDVVYATYTKVGRQVTVQAWIRTDNLDVTGASGSVFITGLPFLSAQRDSGVIGLAANMVNHPSELVVTTAGTASISPLLRYTAIAAPTNLNVTDLTAGATADQNRLQFAMTYFV